MFFHQNMNYILHINQKCGKIIWMISTPPLNTLLCLHVEPINAVVSCDPMKPNLEDGFALRCFQRLSKPKVATRRCPWWDSRYTRASSFPVLSY